MLDGDEEEGEPGYQKKGPFHEEAEDGFAVIRTRYPQPCADYISIEND